MNKPTSLKERSISVLEEPILNMTLPKLGSREEGEDLLFRSAKHNMLSRILGWLVGAWDGKNSEFRKNLNLKNIF